MPLRGKMVAGFVAPDFNRACYPATFAQTLRSLGYRMDLDGASGLGDALRVRGLLRPVFEARKTAIRHLIKNEAWDLCIAVITETDRLQHFYLHALDDEQHPAHAWTVNFYVELDKFIGEVAEMLDGKADLFMVSDHGFQVIKHTFILRDILREAGLSSPDEVQGWSKPDVASRSQVFTLDPGRFYINRKNSRFPHGCVDDSEVPEVLERIEQALLALSDPETGERVVNTIRRKDEGFWGDAVDYAPDLVAATRPGYYFRSYGAPEHEHARYIRWEANHVWNDAIVYAPFSIVDGHQPLIWDVLPTVLRSMGVALPDGIDGRDLRAATPIAALA